MAETPDRYHLTLTSAGRPVMHGWWPLESTARCNVRITETRWNGEEWWVECEMLTADQFTPAGYRYWNELDRFIEAAVFVDETEFPVDEYRLSSRPRIVGGGR